MNESSPNQVPGPWDPAVDQLREWDPKWADACVKMTTNPWTKRILSRKLVELVSVGLNAACTNLNHDGARRHIRAALEAGATREEIPIGSRHDFQAARSGRDIQLTIGIAGSTHPSPATT